MHQDLAPEPSGLALTRQFETFRAVVYDDARPDYVLKPGDKPIGTLTIGYGHTGPDIYVGMPSWTEAKAETVLSSDSQAAYDAIDRNVTVTLSASQRAALGDFVFNVGVGAFKNSTLLTLLNKGQYAQVPSQMDRWIDAQGKPNQGLVSRRRSEINLWNGNAPVIQPGPTGPSVKPDLVPDTTIPRPASLLSPAFRMP